MYRYLSIVQIGYCNENVPVKQEHEPDSMFLLIYLELYTIAKFNRSLGKQ